jgi:hypothetical protein
MASAGSGIVPSRRPAVNHTATAGGDPDPGMPDRPIGVA